MDQIPSREDKISIVAKETLNFLQKNLSKAQEYTVLDVGCGNGRVINYFSSSLDNPSLKKNHINNTSDM